MQSVARSLALLTKLDLCTAQAPFEQAWLALSSSPASPLFVVVGHTPDVSLVAQCRAVQDKKYGQQLITWASWPLFAQSDELHLL